MSVSNVNNQEINVNLAVSCVHTGGNTCEGKYFFSYTPGYISVDEPNTVINIQVQDNAPEMGLTISNVLTTDPFGQFESIKIYQGKKQIIIKNKNDQKTLVNFSVIFKDKNGEMISCDPETGNSGGHNVGGICEYHD